MFTNESRRFAAYGMSQKSDSDLPMLRVETALLARVLVRACPRRTGIVPSVIRCWLLLVFCTLTSPAFGQAPMISVGEENWQKPWVPDLQRPDRQIPIPLERRVDVLILGDGYLPAEQTQFEQDIQKWYDRFVSLTPFRELRGAFRVRGLWKPSQERATAEQKSWFRAAVDTGKVVNATSSQTVAAVFGALDEVEINRATLDHRLSHAYVVMLIKDERMRNPSGVSRRLITSDKRLQVAVAFGADSHHEFGHAYGGLRDEYINQPGKMAPPQDHRPPSLFTISNLGYTRSAEQLPWSHLSPGSPLNPDRTSLIGRLWMGGGPEEGVWHSEARCLMNGTHENWNLQKTRRGAGLRDPKRFCFWCEEIVMARTWQRTGQLGAADDGETLWQEWVKVRPQYQKAFQVPERFQRQNAANADARLEQARIYERPQ